MDNVYNIKHNEEEEMKMGSWKVIAAEIRARYDKVCSERDNARRLLCERDEAREALEDQKDALDGVARRALDRTPEGRDWLKKRDELERERDEARAENAELRRVLEMVEWERVHLFQHPFKDRMLLICPWCGGNGRHEPDCPRQKVLGIK